MALQRTQCPKCQDSGRDNLVYYSNGSAYCFACGYRPETEEKIEVAPSNNNSLLSGVISNISDRKLNSDTCQKYQYQLGQYTGYLGGEYVENEPVHIANYCDEFGQPVAQKIRDRQKRFKILGDFSKVDLYGKQLFEPTEKFPIVITEGEIDAITVNQAFNSMPVVSIPNGVNSARKVLKQNIIWLSKFKEVLLGFDNDEAGIKASKECVDLFEPGKVKIIKWSKKDPNEMLQEGLTDDIKKCVWNATTYRPDSIVTVDDIVVKKPEIGLSWPWKQLTGLTYGIQPKSVYTIGGGSGQGKTEFMKDIILHLAFHHKARVGAMFLEQSPDQTLIRLVGGILGKRLHVPGDDWNEEEIKDASSKLKDNVFFYNHFGSQNMDAVIDKIRYLVKGLDCKYIFLDHLTALAAEMDDERRGIDSAMSKLGGLVHELDFSLFLVSHLAKPKDDYSYEQGRQVTAASFRGSQSIQYWSSFMIGIERNKLAEDERERMVTTVRILKDRFSGEADGCTMYLTYDRNSGKLVEKEEII